MADIFSNLGSSVVRPSSMNVGGPDGLLPAISTMHSEVTPAAPPLTSHTSSPGNSPAISCASALLRVSLCLAPPSPMPTSIGPSFLEISFNIEVMSVSSSSMSLGCMSMARTSNSGLSQPKLMTAPWIPATDEL